MNEQLKEFLDNFDGYHVVLMPHKSLKTEISKININRSLEEVLEYNKQTPCNVYFTPNFQFGDTNAIGQKLQIGEHNAASNGYPCAFVFDFNYNRFGGTKEEFLAEIKSTISKRIIRNYRYIVETQNGYHFYFIIDPSVRKEFNITYGEDFFKLRGYLARELGASIDNKVVSKKGALFRLPLSHYWHIADAYEVRIIEDTGINLFFDELGLVGRYVHQMLESEKDERITYKKLGTTAYKSIMSMTIKEVLSIIDRPELFTSAFIDQTNKTIIGKIGEELSERPAGSPYQLLWHTCSGNASAVSEMIDKIAGGKDIQNSSLFETTETHLIVGKGYSIKFLGGLVQLAQTVVNSKGDYTEKNKIIFRNNINIIGKGFSTASMLGEASVSRLVIIVELDGEERVINQMPSKSAHNKAYTNMFFYGDDNDLGLFFNGIVEDETIPILDIYERSGFYDEDVVFGDRLILGSGDDCRILLGENEFSIAETAEQVTVYDYFNTFKKCYKEEFAVPLFLCALSLGGMNLWNKLEVNPAVLVSGETGCGKSTVAALLKKMLGYDTNAREMALPSISPQPLKQLASDNAILFLEELTKKVGPQTEELLRNIVNRDKAARGTLDGTVRWNFRSPLWVNGERTFKDESLNNRFCGFIMAQDYWKDGGAEEINKLEKCTAYMDVYNTFRGAASWVNDLLLQYKYKLLDEGLPARACDVWSYMFTVNDIFNFGYSFETLIKYVKLHLSKTGLGERKRKNPIGAFTKMLAAAIINKKMSISFSGDRIINGIPHIVVNVLYLDSDIYQQSRGQMYAAIRDINDTLTKDMIEIDDIGITFYIEDVKKFGKFADEDSGIISGVVSGIIDILPTNISSCIKGIVLYDR